MRRLKTGKSSRNASTSRVRDAWSTVIVSTVLPDNFCAGGGLSCRAFCDLNFQMISEKLTALCALLKTGNFDVSGRQIPGRRIRGEDGTTA